MARKRMVDPSLLTSESVARLEVRARYALVGMFMYVDDYGRGRDNTRLIRAHLWPLDDVTVDDVDADLAAMAGEAILCRYTVGSERWLHFPKWGDWQTISHKGKERSPRCQIERSGQSHETLRRVSGDLPPNVVESKSIEEPPGVPFQRQQLVAETRALLRSKATA